MIDHKKSIQDSQIHRQKNWLVKLDVIVHSKTYKLVLKGLMAAHLKLIRWTRPLHSVFSAQWYQRGQRNWSVMAQFRMNSTKMVRSVNLRSNRHKSKLWWKKKLIKNKLLASLKLNRISFFCTSLKETYKKSTSNLRYKILLKSVQSL